MLINEQLVFLKQSFDGNWRWIIQLHKELADTKLENLLLKMQLEALKK